MDKRSTSHTPVEIAYAGSLHGELLPHFHVPLTIVTLDRSVIEYRKAFDNSSARACLAFESQQGASVCAWQLTGLLHGVSLAEDSQDLGGHSDPKDPSNTEGDAMNKPGD
ncbi:hypothetical protein E2C01_047511 [Portunus trituberculatus]|uniref:Uncharacterized protein n=1 Tax=Portunus trituberculatus TaxID=210409 RepID=A0A5B7G1A9_PORTR|nr:hypothetical protein [Portunus trituberculatus]